MTTQTLTVYLFNDDPHQFVIQDNDEADVIDGVLRVRTEEDGLWLYPLTSFSHSVTTLYDAE